MIKENHENKSPKDIDRDRLWAFETDLPSSSLEPKFSLDRWSGLHGGKSTELGLGQGSLMPREVLEFDWGRDREGVGEGEGREEAQLQVAETMFLQGLMGEQVRRDMGMDMEDGMLCEGRVVGLAD